MFAQMTLAAAAVGADGLLVGNAQKHQKKAATDGTTKHLITQNLEN